MIRSAFLSAGVFLVLSGTGLLFVDRVTLTQQASEYPAAPVDWVTSRNELGRREFNPPDWMPFTFIGVGGVTILYSVALPKS